MELHLKIVGALMIALAFVHFVFPKRFNWKDELSGLSLLNRQLMYVHTFFIALAILLMGVVCLYASEEIRSTRLGKVLCVGLFIFWFARLVFQFFVYSPTLWRGKRLETVVHILISFLWLYFNTVFLLMAIG